MRVSTLVLSTLLLLAYSLGSFAQEKESISDIAKQFARKANIVDMSLSPGGDYFALVIQQSEDQQLRIIDVQKGEVTHQVNFDTQWKFGELYWANDERVLVQPAYQPNQTNVVFRTCLLYTSPSPRDLSTSRMPSSA